MKRGQGAKGRSTLFEAEKGDCAKGRVGDFLRKLSWREHRKIMIVIYEKMEHRSAKDNDRLVMLRKKLAELDDELISILQEAIIIDTKHPSFLKDFAQAAKCRGPVYPAEVRMMKAYSQMRWPAPDYSENAIGWPRERTVPYNKLHLVTQDADGNPDKFQFSRMVKRYGLILERGKPGRKSQITKRPPIKKSP